MCVLNRIFLVTLVVLTGISSVSAVKLAADLVVNAV
jgi:hypothetical protein